MTRQRLLGLVVSVAVLVVLVAAVTTGPRELPEPCPDQPGAVPLVRADGGLLCASPDIEAAHDTSRTGP